jgi:hypothetical protein
VSGNRIRPVHRCWLAEQRLQPRYLVGLGRHHQELSKRAVDPCNDEVVGVHTRSVQDDLYPEHVGQRGDLDQVEPGQQTIGSLDLWVPGTASQPLINAFARGRPRPTEPQARRQGEGKGVGLTLPSSSSPLRIAGGRDTSDVTGPGVPDLVDRRPARDPHAKRSPSDCPSLVSQRDRLASPSAKAE